MDEEKEIPAINLNHYNLGQNAQQNEIIEMKFFTNSVKQMLKLHEDLLRPLKDYN